jgi:hypothetical protein
VYTIVVAGGGPVGGVQQIRFRPNDRVRLIVQSDTANVVQVPGYGISRRVRAGGSARIYFETSKKGLFSIELADGHARIGVMTVG